jgi:hypothetical protein
MPQTTTEQLTHEDEITAMAGLLELHTITLNQEEAQKFIEAACRSEYFRPLRTKWAPISFRKNVLDACNGYEVELNTGVQLLMPQRVETPASLGHFWTMLQGVKGQSGFGGLRLSISESGRDPDSDEEIGLDISGGLGFAGPYLTIVIGPLSPGYSNRNHWKTLATKLLAPGSTPVTGTANQKIEEVLFPGRQVQNVNNWNPRAVKDLCRQGKIVLVREQLDSGVTFWGLEEEHLQAALLHALQLEPSARVIASEVSIWFPDFSHYEAAIETLNSAGFSPWIVELTAKPRYTVAELDKLVAEMAFFHLPVGSLRSRKLGDIDVELSYGGGDFIFYFAGEYKSNAQSQALEALIIEFARGRDIVDRTLI